LAMTNRGSTTACYFRNQRHKNGKVLECETQLHILSNNDIKVTTKNSTKYDDIKF